MVEPDKTTNFYIATLAKELTNHCLQYTTSHGDLNSGGLGPWAYLQFRLSLETPNVHERWALLQSAKDAALETLKSKKSTINKDSLSSSISIYTNERIGAHAMLAVIHHELESFDTTNQKQVQKYTNLVLEELAVSSASFPAEECELLYGRAGGMQAIFFLRQTLGNPSIGVSECLEMAVAILKEGMENSQNYKKSHGQAPPLVWSWRGTTFLGAAHGLVGILMSLLGLSDLEMDFLEQTVPNAKSMIRRTIDSLEGFCYPSGNLRVTMDGKGGSDRQVQWAHGAPGYILLLVRANQAFKSCDDRECNFYLERAYEIAENVLWARRKLCRSMSLTNGMVGIAFVFSALAQQGPEGNVWIQRAEQLSRYTVNNWKDTLSSSSSSGRPYSLMEGLGGLVCLLLGLGKNIPTAQFPFFYQPVPIVGMNQGVASGSQPIEKQTIDGGKHDHADEDSELAGSIDQLADVDEFKDSAYDDMPVRGFLVESMRSLMTENGIETVQPANLDEEKHEDLVDLIAVGDSDFEEDEFESPDASDGPNKTFLRAQDSEHEHNFASYLTKPMLDDEKHNDLSLPEDYSDIECDEFETGNEADAPNTTYLRAQDSSHDREFLTIVEKPILDDEKHKSRTSQFIRADSCSDFDEFEVGNLEDAPVPRYLQKQVSREYVIQEYVTLNDAKESSSSPNESLRGRKGKPAKSRWHSPEKKRSGHPSPRLGSKKAETASTKTSDRSPEKLPSTRTPTKLSPAIRTTKHTLDRVQKASMSSTPSPTNTLSPTRRANRLQKLGNAYLRDCLDVCRGEGNLLTGGLGGSVYLRIKQSELQGGEESTKLLEAALDNTMAALKIAEQRRGKSRATLLSGEFLGAKCLLASILHRLGYGEAAVRHAGDVLEYLEKACSELPADECSLLHGRAGMLQTIWFLRQELNNDEFGRDFAVATSSSMLLEGIKNGKEDENLSLFLMWKWRGRSFLGAATGVVGILYSLLGHTEEEWSALDTRFPQVREVVKTTIDGLKDHTHKSGNLRSSLDGHEEDKLCDWSHGAPGYCMLLLKAFEVFSDETYLSAAKALAEEVIWPRRMQRKGLGILRGISGNAYIFLLLSRADTSNTDLWIDRAVQLALSAVDNLNERVALTKRPNSLFDGLGGFVSLLLDLQIPEKSYMPFFEEKKIKLEGQFLVKSPVRQITGQQVVVATRDSLPLAVATSSSVAKDAQEIRTSQDTVNNRISGAGGGTSKKSGELELPSNFAEECPMDRTPGIKTKNVDTSGNDSPHSGKLVKKVILHRRLREKTIRIARQQLQKCLENATSAGNLMKGGLGPCVLLRLKSIEILVNKPGGNAIQTLKAALREVETALSIAENRIGSFHVSVFTGEFVGAKCLLAVILFKLGNRDEAYYHVSTLLMALDKACSTLPSTDCDVMYGRAGALQAIWFLRQEFSDPSIGRDFVLSTSQAILLEGIANGRAHATFSLLVWKWRGKAFLGAAHGSVGILHSLLGHTEDEWQFLERIFPRVKEVICRSIGGLAAFRHPSGNLRTTFDGPDEDTFTEWAHGSPGYCLLLVRAAEVFKESNFLALAVETAEHVLWPRRMQRHGLGLTRGASGMGYVFLTLSHCDRANSDLWKTRAEHVAHAAISDVSSLLPMSNRPYSLYEGLGGLVSLLMDLNAKGKASFPFFDSRSYEQLSLSEVTNPEILASPSLADGKEGPGARQVTPSNSSIPSTHSIQGKSGPEASATETSQPGQATQPSVQPVESRNPIRRDKSARTDPSATPTPTKLSGTDQGNASPRGAISNMKTTCRFSQSGKATQPTSQPEVTEKRSRSEEPEKTNLPAALMPTKQLAAQAAKQSHSASERSTRSNRLERPGQRLVLSPIAMRGLLSERSPNRQKVPLKLPGSMQYLGTEDSPRNPTLLAQQLITACLQRNTAEGNLYSGGIGSWIFLQSKMAHHLMRNPEGCRIKAMKPLQSAREAAREALADAETRKGPVHPSIMTGEWVGSKCLFASVLYSLGDVQAARKHGEELISKLDSACATKPHLECDVMYGRAGALQAIWYLRQELEDPTFGRSFALSTSLSILIEGLKCAREKKNGWVLLWDWRGQVFLGAANGVTGILHSILGHSEEELDLLESHLPRFRDAIKHTINNLHQHRHPSGNLRSTLNVNEEDRHYEWAHGCTGYILLLLRAGQVLNEPHYLELAKGLALSVLWPRREERIGVGLSRGLSGIGYVFLGLARVDADNRREWMERARYYVEASISNWGDLLSLTNRPYSLYEGLGGLVNLILDLENLETGHFPFFETRQAAPPLEGNRSVTFSHVRKNAFKRIMARPSDDAVTASTALSTQLGSPPKEERQNAPPMSPLTDPNVTPAKDRMSPSNRSESVRASTGRVFPEQRKLHKHTKSDHVPLAARTTFSSRAKSRVETPEKKTASPSIRKLVGGFNDSD